MEGLQVALKTVQETLDEWLLLQSSCLSLSALFASPETRKQLPPEAAKFAAAAAAWKTLCSELAANNSCLPACTKEGRLQTLKTLNP